MTSDGKKESEPGSKRILVYAIIVVFYAWLTSNAESISRFALEILGDEPSTREVSEATFLVYFFALAAMILSSIYYPEYEKHKEKLTELFLLPIAATFAAITIAISRDPQDELPLVLKSLYFIAWFVYLVVAPSLWLRFRDSHENTPEPNRYLATILSAMAIALLLCATLQEGIPLIRKIVGGAVLPGLADFPIRPSLFGTIAAGTLVLVTYPRQLGLASEWRQQTRWMCWLCVGTIGLSCFYGLLSEQDGALWWRTMVPILFASFVLVGALTPLFFVDSKKVFGWPAITGTVFGCSVACATAITIAGHSLHDPSSTALVGIYGVVGVFVSISVKAGVALARAKR